MQKVIDAAYNGDFSLFHDLLFVTTNPFDGHPEFEDFEQTPSEQEKGITSSCSS